MGKILPLYLYQYVCTVLHSEHSGLRAKCPHVAIPACVLEWKTILFLSSHLITMIVRESEKEKRKQLPNRIQILLLECVHDHQARAARKTLFMQTVPGAVLMEISSIIFFIFRCCTVNQQASTCPQTVYNDGSPPSMRASVHVKSDCNVMEEFHTSMLQ